MVRSPLQKRLASALLLVTIAVQLNASGAWSALQSIPVFTPFIGVQQADAQSNGNFYVENADPKYGKTWIVVITCRNAAGQNVTYNQGGNSHTLAALVRQNIVNKGLGLTQPQQAIVRSDGGTGGGFNWNDNSGTIHMPTVTAVCQILGNLSDTYVSSTCRDDERSGIYPSGKCNFHSPGDNNMHRFTGTLSAPAACADGADNDGDGLRDFPADPGCANAQDNDEFNAPTPQCSDGIDNDGDGATDLQDFSCSGSTDNDETNPKAACQDGLDNDGDGLVDFPQDPGCASRQDNDEYHQIQCPATRVTANFEGRQGPWEDVAPNGDATPPTFVSNVQAGGTVKVISANGTYSARIYGGQDQLPLTCDKGTLSFTNNSNQTLSKIRLDSALGGVTVPNGATRAYLSHDEPGSYNYFDNSGNRDRRAPCVVTLDVTPSSCQQMQCSDGVDNDGDGLVDFPQDPGCVNAQDNDESPRNIGNLDVEKTLNGTIVPGQNASYTITVRNTGTVAAQNVNVYDYFLDSQDLKYVPFTFVSSTGVTCSYQSAAQQVSCPVGTVSPNQTVTMTLTFAVPANQACTTQIRNRVDAWINGQQAGADVDDVSSNVQCVAQCRNGIDDDGDGRVDFPADPGCSNQDDDTEGGDPACADRVDNDNDGLVDFPQDPGCVSLSDNDEYNAPQCPTTPTPATFAFTHPQQLVDYLNSLPASLMPVKTTGVDGANPLPNAATMDKICDLKGYNDVIDFYTNPAYSCEDNTLVYWNGSQFVWTRNNSCALGSQHLHRLTCGSPKQVCVSQCSDGVDNDGDGATDFPADFSCSSDTDNDETNPKAACQDGADNDGDGLVDFPQDPGCASRQDNDEFNQAQTIDLATQKTGPASVVRGQPILYTLTVRNNGQVQATNLVVTDQIPAGLVYNDALSHSTCSQQNSAVVCTHPSLGVGQTGTFTIAFDTPALQNCTAPVTVINSFSVTAAQQDSNPGNNTTSTVANPTRIDCPAVMPQCRDGIDNDGDGKVDLADPGCVNSDDNDEFHRPTDPTPTNACQNGIDDDGDGLVDFPQDPGCTSKQDNDETNGALQCQNGRDDDGDGLVDFTGGYLSETRSSVNFGSTGPFLDCPGKTAAECAAWWADTSRPNGRTGPTLALQNLQAGQIVRFQTSGNINYGTHTPGLISSCRDGLSAEYTAHAHQIGIAQFTNDAGQVINPGIPTPDGKSAILLRDFVGGITVPAGATKLWVTHAEGYYLDNSGTCTISNVQVLTRVGMDPQCSSPTDNNEAPESQCSDGIDNDQDGLTDFPFDPGCANLQDNDEFNQPQTVDLSIQKTGPASVTRGQTIFYTLTVGNAGSVQATNVVVSDNVPAGLTYNDALSYGPCSVANNVVTCSIGTLAANQFGSFLVAFDTPALQNCTAPVNVVNTATISATQQDSNQLNNTASTQNAPTRVDCPVVQNQCQDGQDNDFDGRIDFPADPGCSSPTDTNEGDDPACADRIDNDNDGLIDFPFDPGCSTLNDTDEFNQVQTVDLSIQKTGPASVTRGQTIFYSIQVGNSGTTQSTNVVVTDNVPAGLTYNDALSYGPCSMTNNVVTCALGTLAAGQFGSFLIAFDTPAIQNCTTVNVVNAATIGGTEQDSNQSNNTASTQNAPTRVDCPVVQAQCQDGQDNDFDGRIDFPADPGCSSATDTNEGDDPACADRQDNDQDGLVDFPQDPGCSSLSDTDEFNAPQTQCSDGVDNDGDGRIDTNDAGCSSTTDTNEGDGAADLAISLAGPATVQGGSTATYVATIANNGPDAATMPFSIRISMPAGVTFNAAQSSQGCAQQGTSIVCSNITLGLFQQTARSIVFNIPGNGQQAAASFNLLNFALGVEKAHAQVGGVCNTTLQVVGTIQGVQTDPNQANNQSQVSTFVSCQPLAQCQDGVDNDNDGKVDFPQDPGCSSATDTDETDVPQFGCIEVKKETFDPHGNPLPIAAQFTFTLDATRIAYNDASGRARFDQVLPGTHGVAELIPSGWTQLSIWPQNGTVTVAPGTTCAQVTFRNRQVFVANAQCADGYDNDGDGLTDYPQDTGCSSATDNDEYNSTFVPQCQDGVDNDGDGLKDYPQDTGCENAADNNEQNAGTPITYACNDNLDNDGDGLKDYPADPGCSSATDADETNVVAGTFACNDNVDNDGDGLKDYPADPGCSSATDADEFNFRAPRCSDGIDNDGDGLKDYPQDTGCTTAYDDNEYNDRLWLDRWREFWNWNW